MQIKTNFLIILIYKEGQLNEGFIRQIGCKINKQKY